MDLQVTENMAKELMAQWGLDGWTLVWTDAQSQFGQCRYGPRQIALSRVLVALNDEAEVRDTVLHEIAHALVGHAAGHGARWRMACLQVGARPDRTRNFETPPMKWTGTCPKGCGFVMGRRTLFKEARTMACPRCCEKYNGGAWHPALKLIWTENVL